MKLCRWLAPTALAVSFALTSVPKPVLAQEPPPADGEEKSEGRPVDGYILIAMLSFAACFAVGKTARR